LKTADQAGLDEKDNVKVVTGFIQEAIDEHFKLIMIRPDMVSLASQMVSDANLQIGTVIDFPGGNSTLLINYLRLKEAIQDGANLDYVCNYEAFKNGDIDLVKEEVLKGTQLGIENNKVVKWIIEIAALNDNCTINALIKNIVISNFEEKDFASVFVKSSTDFIRLKIMYPMAPSIMLMLENATPLPVKAAGGVRTYDEAVEMIKLE
jgi:deoxyribose-phosphate aldolase